MPGISREDGADGENAARQIADDSVINWANFVSQVFNGLVLGALLALISSGLTIIYGTLGVLNLAHGAMFMLGGYAGWVAYTYTGSFVVAVIAGSLFVMLVGVVMERVVIRHFYSRPHEDQLLVTFGLGIVFVETVRFFFGSLSKAVPAPPALVGITPIGFMLYPTYRLALLGIVAVALIALYIVLYRTRIGMIVRAGIEDSVMVDSLGIDVYKVFMLVFGIGAMAAGFAGIVNARWSRSRPTSAKRFWCRPSWSSSSAASDRFRAPCWAASSPARSLASRRCSIPAIPTSCFSWR